MKTQGTKNPLHGKGRLTDTIINSMQNFYGLAMRNNVENIYAMKKAVGAILFHCTAFSDPEYRHRMCPRDEKTWCKCQFDKLKGTNNCIDKIPIPINIYSIIKPVFESFQR